MLILKIIQILLFMHVIYQKRKKNKSMLKSSITGDHQLNIGFPFQENRIINLTIVLHLLLKAWSMGKRSIDTLVNVTRETSNLIDHEMETESIQWNKLSLRNWENAQEYKGLPGYLGSQLQRDMTPLQLH